MPYLNYGPQLQLRLDDEAADRAVEAIAAHASRGGWVSVTDTCARQWSLLISAGVCVWLSPD